MKEMNLKEATKQCRAVIRSIRTDLRDEESEDNFILAEAIETVLKTLEKLQKNCKEMIKEKQELTSALLDSIPKKKIEDMKEELEEIRDK